MDKIKKYIQEVNSCRNCPNREPCNYNLDQLCILSDRYIDKIDTIPSWCELEDY